jgi:hypothetical protein
LVPNLANGAVVNDAFEFAGGDVPSVLRVGRRLWLADALAASLVPDLLDALEYSAVFSSDAFTSAIVVVPEIVVGAGASNADAFTGKYVELLILVVTFLELISARAVKVAVELVSPDELALRTGDEFVCA